LGEAAGGTRKRASAYRLSFSASAGALIFSPLYYFLSASSSLTIAIPHGGLHDGEGY
jgi:hypothetical protein